MSVRALALAAVMSMPVAIDAQSLPSANRKPALTRKENWGVSIGVEMISASFKPTRCPSLVSTPGGGLSKVTVPCDDRPYAYETRGVGISMNAGVMFLRHFMLGGEVGTVGFSGNKSFADETTTPPVSYTTTTVNSIVGSAYVGLITSPIGKNPKLGRKVWAGALLGRSKWSGERTIKTCDQCVVDPLQMGWGYFVQPFAMFGGGDKDGGGGFRLAYRHHFGGYEAMHSTFTFGLFFAFGRL